MYSELIGNYKKYRIKSLYGNKLTLNSVANQYRILKQQFGNLSRTIGNLFLPIVEMVLPVVNGLVIAMNQLLQSFGTSLWGDNWLKDIMSGTSAGHTDDSLENLGDDAEDLDIKLDDASESAKKLKNNLIGIDKLNIISPKDSDPEDDKNKGKEIDLSNQIAGAVADYEKVWEEAFERSENLAQKYANRIVKALQKGDWKGIGKYWSDKLTGALKSIDWTKVYSNAKGFGSGLAEFLNGFITPETFATVGSTIAKSLNASIYTSLEFAKTFDWANLGESIGAGITAFFEDFDFIALAKNMNTWANGIYTTLWKAFTNINWGTVAKGLFDFLGELDPQTVILLIAANRFRNLAASVGVWGATKGIFKNVGFGIAGVISELSQFKGISQKVQWSVLRLQDKFQRIRGSLTATQKGLIGLVAICAEFRVVSDTVKGLVNGSESLAEGIAKITVVAGLAATALKLAFGLSAPWAVGISTAIALVTTFVTTTKESSEKIGGNWKGLSQTTLNELDKIDARIEEHDKLRKQSDENAKNETAEITKSENLFNELEKIVDENGKVKKGYEARAKYITGELSTALGTEIEITDGIIQKYKQVKKSIKQVIAEKKKNALLSAYEEEYVEALKNEAQYQKDIEKAVKANEQAKKKLATAQENFDIAYEKYVELHKKWGTEPLAKDLWAESYTSSKQLKNALKEAEKQANKTDETLSSLENDYKDSINTIRNYEEVVALGSNSTVKEVNKKTQNLINNQDNNGRKTVQEYSKGIQEETKKGNLFNEVITGAITNIDTKGTASAVEEKIKNIFKGVQPENIRKVVEKLMGKSFSFKMTATPDIVVNGSPVLSDMKNQFSFTIPEDTITFKANGGYLSTGQMFVAREAGPELVGQIGNRTAVINNDQIVSAVSQGVASAVASVFANGNYGTSEQTIVVQSVLDGKIVAQSVNRHNARSGAKMLGYGTGYN